MKPLLLHRTHHFDRDKKSPENEKELAQDLGLTILFDTMAAGDDFLRDECQKTMFSFYNTDIDTISHRQEILKDCLNNQNTIKSVYGLTVEAMKRRKESWYTIFSKQPSSILSSAVGMMKIYMDILKKLRILAEENQTKFHSNGFLSFFKMVSKEFGDDYFAEIQDHLKVLKLANGISINAKLGNGNKGGNYQLVRLPEEPKSWWTWLFPKKTTNYTFKINPRDNGGIRILGELRDKGLNDIANVLAQSNDHIFDFLNALRAELAFYLGCLNLHTKLSGIGAPISFPTATTANTPKHSFQGLYDISLALSMNKKLVGNTLNSNKAKLVIITGANQGGKTAFIRGIGLSQIMMQAGMFVAAESYSGSLCTALFTHFKRKEDAKMESGKLDEELKRMDQIIKAITPKAMVLFNESFASTNEKEGSEIAKQIVKALLEKGINVYIVTHLYAFANDFNSQKDENTIFLRAEREADGKRTFKLIEGEPLQTSYGADLYKKIFKS